MDKIILVLAVVLQISSIIMFFLGVGVYTSIILFIISAAMSACLNFMAIFVEEWDF